MTAYGLVLSGVSAISGTVSTGIALVPLVKGALVAGGAAAFCSLM